jgi:hypothetical protein
MRIRQCGAGKVGFWSVVRFAADSDAENFIIQSTAHLPSTSSRLYISSFLHKMKDKGIHHVMLIKRVGRYVFKCMC